MDQAIIADAIARHERIAFQLSGGRDSVAALFAMRSHWDRMSIYHLNTGDRFPETVRVIDEIAKLVPVITIESDAKEYRNTAGFPSDVVPVDNTPFGRMVSGERLRIVSRYDCCGAVVMLPLYRRMDADGITLIVRGQRHSDYARAPIRSGQSDGRFEVLFPIEDWSTEQVNQFIHENGLPVTDFYQRGLSVTPECMGCTAWWGEGRLQYLQESDPTKYDQVSKKIIEIKQEIGAQLQPIQAI